MANLKGVLTALSTPFNSDDRIDVALLRRVVDRSIDGGVHGVVAAGSTGEVGTMDFTERMLLIDTVIDQTAGRVPVIAQTGATTTAEAIRLSKAAEKSGANVLMLLTPFYEPLSIDETKSYLKDVSASVSIPVMLYNIPAVTGTNLDPDTVRELATDVDNIKYIKDSSANWEQALRLIHHHSDLIGTFIGWDSYIYSALVEGSAGVMAGTANVVPEQIVSVYNKVAAGDLVGARDEWKKVYPVLDFLLANQFIATVKSGLEIEGIPAGAPRKPTAASTPAQVAELRRLLGK